MAWPLQDPPCPDPCLLCGEPLGAGPIYETGPCSSVQTWDVWLDPYTGREVWTHAHCIGRWEDRQRGIDMKLELEPEPMPSDAATAPVRVELTGADMARVEEVAKERLLMSLAARVERLELALVRAGITLKLERSSS